MFAFCSKLLRLVTVSAVLLAHFACVCASTAATSDVASDPNATVKPAQTAHACHGHMRSSPESEPPIVEHETPTPTGSSECPHCTLGGQPPAVMERGNDLHSPALVSTLAFPPTAHLPSFLADVIAVSLSHQRPTSCGPPNAPPPPDLLRVKCTLQI